jgi:glycosyltransferase involved in cell wall biosynthesis
MNDKNISIIIPVYNEEKEIENVINRLNKTLSNNGINYEIIVVNDASTDATERILLQRNDIKLISNVENIGYGGSIKKGIEVAKYDIVAITDGDNTYPVEVIPDLLNFIGDYDMVVGARNKIVYSKLNWVKQIGRKVIEILCSYLTAHWIPDINSGLRLFKKDIVLKFIDQLCNRFSFTTTLTLLSFFNGCKVKYVSIGYKQERTSSVSKVRIWRDGLKTFLLVIKLGLRYAPHKIIFLLLLLFVILYLIF